MALKDFLDGVRVLDLSQYLPGPYATQILADMGAHVLKVEPPKGDPIRRLNPFDGSPTEGPNPFHVAMNAGKSVLRMDLKSAHGKAAFAELAAAADVLLESYRPGVMERLGFGRQRLAELNQRLIHCALTGYGQTGPERDKSGHDINYLALAGGLTASGTAGRPVISWPQVADHAAGMQAALAVLGALAARHENGRGIFIDVSLADAGLAWQQWSLTAALGPGADPGRQANLLNGGAACYGIYATVDGCFVTIGALEEKFWANFCAAVERPEWIARQFETMPQRDLIGEVAALFAGASRAAWEKRLGGVDCCFQAALDYAEVPGHPQVKARGFVVQGEGSAAGTQVLFPAWVDDHPPAPRPPIREVDVETAVTEWRDDT